MSHKETRPIQSIPCINRNNVFLDQCPSIDYNPIPPSWTAQNQSGEHSLHLQGTTGNERRKKPRRGPTRSIVWRVASGVVLHSSSIFRNPNRTQHGCTCTVYHPAIRQILISYCFYETFNTRHVHTFFYYVRK